MKLWHDDVRRPPDDSWFWARTNDEAKEVLATGAVTEVSLDHDLGYEGPPPGRCEVCGGDGKARDHFGRLDVGDCGACDGDGFIGGDILYIAGNSEDDGRKLVQWMIENDCVPPKITIHSWNPDGARQMAEMLRLHGHDPIVRPFELA